MRPGAGDCLLDAGLKVLPEVQLHVPFRGQIIGDFYADIVVNGTILVEVKTSAQIEDYAKAQILNYLLRRRRRGPASKLRKTPRVQALRRR